MNKTWLLNGLIFVVVVTALYFIPVLPSRLTAALIAAVLIFLAIQYFNPENIPLKSGLLTSAGAVSLLLPSSWSAGIKEEEAGASIWSNTSLGTYPAQTLVLVALLLLSTALSFRQYRLNRQAAGKQQHDTVATVVNQLTELLNNNHREVMQQIISLPNPLNADGLTSEASARVDDLEIKAKLESRLTYGEKAAMELRNNPGAIEEAQKSYSPVIGYEFAISLASTSPHLAVNILEQVSKANVEIDIQTELVLSDLYLKTNRSADAERANNRVLEVDPENSYAISRRAYFAHSSGDAPDAERLSLELIDSKKKRGLQVALDYQNLAGLLSDIRRPDEAIPYIQSAYEAIEDGDSSTTIGSVKLVEAAVVRNKGSLTGDTKLYLKSQKLYFRSHAILEKSHNQSFLLSWSKREIARFYFEEFRHHQSCQPPASNAEQQVENDLKDGALQLAEKYLLESLDLTTATFQAYDYPHIRGVFKLLLEIYRRQNRIAEYLELLRKHEAVFRTKDGADELILESGIRVFADLYMEVHRFDLAEPLYTEAITLLNASTIPDQDYYCSALSNLGSNYRKYHNDLDKAESYTRLALENRKLAKGPLHFKTAQTRKNLAHILRLKGKPHFKEARTLYLEALRILTLEAGYENMQVAKWIRDFAILDLDDGNYWLARLKAQYAYTIYQRLGKIQMLHIPLSIGVAVPPGTPPSMIPETIEFPPIPTGPIHEDLTALLNSIDEAEMTAIHQADEPVL